MTSRIQNTSLPHPKRYRAFISYSRKDEVWARRIHAALEAYRAPRGVNAHVDHKSRRLGRIFRDDDEMPAAQSLGTVIESALSQADTLIVICSPHSARSAWVDTEVRRFRVDPDARVLAVIVSGTPNAATPEEECFCPGLRWRVTPDGRLSDIADEPLAPDIRREGFDRVITRLAAGILGVSFDVLWQRQARRRQKSRLGLSAMALTLGCAVFAAFSVISARSHATIPAAALEMAATRLETARGTGNVQTMEEAMRLAIFASTSPELRPAARDLIIETMAATRTQWRTNLRHGPTRHLAFSDDGAVLFAVAETGQLTLFNAVTGREINRLNLGGHPLGMAANGAQILVHSPESTHIWQTDTWKATPLPAVRPTCAEFNERTQTLITCNADGGARLWHTTTGALIQNIAQDGPPWTHARFDTKGDYILFSAGYGAWSIWDVESGQSSATVSHSGRNLDWTQIGIYPYFIAALPTPPFGAIRTPDTVVPVSGHNAPLTVARLFGNSPEQLNAASGDADGRLIVSAIARPVSRVVTNLKGHTGAITALALSPDHTLLATAGVEGDIRVWSLAPLAAALRNTLARNKDPLAVACGYEGYFLHRSARIITPADTTGLPALTSFVGSDVCDLASDGLAK